MGYGPEEDSWVIASDFERKVTGFNEVQNGELILKEEKLQIQNERKEILGKIMMNIINNVYLAPEDKEN